MAVNADGSALLAGLHGLPVHAFRIGFGDIGVALSASYWNIEVVNLRTSVLRRQYSVTAVTVGTTCSRAISAGDGASVHTLTVEFYGVREGNFVPREKLLVAMATGASVGQIFLGHG